MVSPQDLINGYLPQQQGAIESAPQFSAIPQGPLGSNPTYGGMLGYIEAKKEMRSDNADNRAERTLKMGEEAFGWEREKQQKEKLLQAGMAKAATDGGYEGVISYLKTADPERALKFTDAKLDLDSKIMKNDVMKNITIPSAKEEALMESYGRLGKMGQAILKAPPGDRESMYQQFLPIAKMINPEMPDNLQDAAPIMLLSAAQATPANMLFKDEKNNLEAQSAVGRNGADIVALRKKGFSPGDGTPQGDTLTTLLAEQNRVQMNAAAAGAKLTQTQIKQDQNVMNNTTTMSKNLAQASIITPKYEQTYSTMKGALQTLSKDPNNSQAMSNLLGAFTKANAGGNPSDYDSKLQQGTRSWQALEVKIHEILSGRAQPLNPEDLGNLNSVIDNVHEEYISRQQAIENQFADVAQKNPTLVDWDTVVKPSQNFMKSQQQNTINAEAASGQIPPDIQAKAQQMLSKGIPKEEVDAAVKQVMQQRAQAHQQTVSPTYTPQDAMYGEDSSKVNK